MGRRKGLRVCTVAGCGELCEGGRCAAHRAAAERKRGTSAQRGYGSRHRTKFRKGVLERDRVCVVCRRAKATVADHHPVDRRTLVLKNLDADDPKYGRGLCASCHGRATATNPDQAGGWNRR